MKKYKYLFFDLDDTLLNFAQGERIAVRETFEHIGAEMNEKNLALYRTQNRLFWQGFENGTYKTASDASIRFKNLSKAIRFKSNDFDEINTFYMTSLAKYAFILDNSIEILKKLATKYDIYIVTNGLQNVAVPKATNSGIMHFAKNIFVSETIGYSKPSKAYFDYCFSQIKNFRKAEALIIGDSLTSDIRGGQNAEIDSCWYNPKSIKNNTEIKPTYEISSFNQLLEILGEKNENRFS